MSSSSIPAPWRVEFGCGVRLVITDASQLALAASLIETLRAGKGVSR
jgi:hypothetical protein